MKKKLYMKPSSSVVRLNIQDQLLDEKMGNHSGPHASEGYSGDDQAAKRNTLTDEEEEGWEAFPKPRSPWDE